MLREEYTLRISVTSMCNLRCIYCNPSNSKNDDMTEDTLLKIINSACKAGIKKISWTGGEPTMHKNIINIIKMARDMGIKKQSMTTNGVLFHKFANELKDAGLTKVNISLDTLNKDEYKQITKCDKLADVLASIEKAVEVFGKVKINHVVTQSNKSTIPELIEFAQHFGDTITVRFLEIVPCNNPSEKDVEVFKSEFIPVSEMQKEFEKIGPIMSLENSGDVPKSRYFKILGKNGIFGFNPNESVGYHCDRENCPKIRVSPNGYVSNCTTDLRYCKNFSLLSEEESDTEMEKLISEKENRNYDGFVHKQKYYNFWRFGIIPEESEIQKILKNDN